jgi:hypothetical protein
MKMKHFWMIAVVCVAVLLIAVPAQAQINVDRIGVSFSNFTYANSESDTSGSQQVAAARALMLVLTTADSAIMDVYVQYKDSNATWTTKFTDSLKTTVNTGKTQEYSLKDGDSDAFDAMVYGVRVVLAGRSAGNGVTTPTFTAKWYYKP